MDALGAVLIGISMRTQRHAHHRIFNNKHDNSRQQAQCACEIQRGQIGAEVALKFRRNMFLQLRKTQRPAAEHMDQSQMPHLQRSGLHGWETAQLDELLAHLGWQQIRGMAVNLPKHPASYLASTAPWPSSSAG